jgi:hypothetical protein
VFSRLLCFLLCLGKAVSRIPMHSPAAGPRREPSSPCRTPDHRPRFLSCSTTGCYAAYIRAGRHRPHPRHWQALAGLVGVSEHKGGTGKFCHDLS